MLFLLLDFPAASRVRKGTGCDTGGTRALTDTAELLFAGTGY